MLPSVADGGPCALFVCAASALHPPPVDSPTMSPWTQQVSGLASSPSLSLPAE